jgi:hypothetical protein
LKAIIRFADVVAQTSDSQCALQPGEPNVCMQTELIQNLLAYGIDNRATGIFDKP